MSAADRKYIVITLFVTMDVLDSTQQGSGFTSNGKIISLGLKAQQSYQKMKETQTSSQNQQKKTRSLRKSNRNNLDYMDTPTSMKIPVKNHEALNLQFNSLTERSSKSFNVAIGVFRPLGSKNAAAAIDIKEETKANTRQNSLKGSFITQHDKVKFKLDLNSKIYEGLDLKY